MARMPVAVSWPRSSHTRQAPSLCSNHSLAWLVCPGRLSPLFSLLSSDLWTNVSVVKPGPRASDEMGTRVCVCVCPYTQYTSTSCWIGVTSPHWDLIYYPTAICACVCACALVNTLCLCISEAWWAAWQHPRPLHLPAHTSTQGHTWLVHI